MSPKAAKAIAMLIRRQHGELAERFIVRQIMHFRREASRRNAVVAWRLVLRTLARERGGTRAHIPEAADPTRATQTSTQPRKGSNRRGSG